MSALASVKQRGAVASPYLRRLMGAAVLDSAIYEEVEADESATMQAFATVLLSSVAAGVGSRGLEQAGRLNAGKHRLRGHARIALMGGLGADHL